MESPQIAEQTHSGYMDNTFFNQGDNQRIKALAVYAETNNYHEASRATGIPHTTIYGWANSEAGMAVVEQVRTAVRANAAWVLVENTITALNLVNQRLKAGTDPHVLKNGCIVMRPISLKDAVMAAAVSQDKLAMLTGMLEGSKQVDKRLESIASRLLAKLNDKDDKQPIESKPLASNGEASPWVE